MAKTKQGPALFELLKGTREHRADARRQAPGEPPQDEVLVREDRRESRTPPGLPPGTGESTRPPVESKERSFCEVSGGCVRFSLTQRAATIVLAVVVLALVGMFYVGYHLGEVRGKEKGRRAVQARVADEIEEARRAAPTRNLFDGIGNDPTAAVTGRGGEPPARGPAAAVGGNYVAHDVSWVSGHNYIVVQDFKSDAWSDAVRAREFLEENGVGTTILELERSETYKYRLMTVTGFNLDDTVQKKLADEYLNKVRDIGQAYSEGGGRYDFQSAYFKKLTGNHW